ncbi:hypothetical protein GCM10027360_32840 [Amycolatopsis echigonensis]
MLDVLRHYRPAGVKFVLCLLFRGISENRLRHPTPLARFHRRTAGIVVGLHTGGQLPRQFSAKMNAQPIHGRGVARVDARNARRPWK